MIDTHIRAHLELAESMWPGSWPAWIAALRAYASELERISPVGAMPVLCAVCQCSNFTPDQQRRQNGPWYYSKGQAYCGKHWPR